MDEKEITITTTQLAKFLNIEYSRLDVWLKKNIFLLDNPLPGKGYTRQFDFNDVIAAGVASEVMKWTRGFDIARNTVELFRNDPNKKRWFSIVISHIEDKYKISWGGFGKRELKESDIIFIDEENLTRSLIIIPVPEITKKVEKLFNKLKTEVKKES